LAELIARLLLHRPISRLAKRSGGGTVSRLLLIVLSGILESSPVVVFAFTASFVLPLTHARFATGRVAEVFITATLWARLVLVWCRVILLSPNSGDII